MPTFSFSAGFGAGGLAKMEVFEISVTTVQQDAVNGDVVSTTLNFPSGVSKVLVIINGVGYLGEIGDATPATKFRVYDVGGKITIRYPQGLRALQGDRLILIFSS